jgi:hypothetical protein
MSPAIHICRRCGLSAISNVLSQVARRLAEVNTFREKNLPCDAMIYLGFAYARKLSISIPGF